MTCPLCTSDKIVKYTHVWSRDYYKCTNCDLIFVPQHFFLDNKAEIKRYNLHKNSIDDKGYRDFLMQIVNLVKAKQPKTATGLDFGSGPSPVLATLLEIEGFTMDFYDPYYAENSQIFKKTYDFITLTEVAEHFYNPALEFERLFSMLKPGGFLFVMTSKTDTIKDFDNWYYSKDSTHVCFYADKSLSMLASKHNLTIEVIDYRISIFNK